MICGTVWNYNWDDIRAYAHSLSACGYKGPKVLFVRNISADALNNLAKLDFELIPWEPKRPDLHPITQRWEPILDYLKTRGIPESIVITDVQDCVFQRDPMPFLKQHPGKIIGATESIRVRDENTRDGTSDNFKWCKEAVDEQFAESVGDEEVLCHGTISGDGRVVYDYINALYLILSTHVNPRLIDQGPGQWILRQWTFKNNLYIPRLKEGFILSGNFCWNSSMDPAPVIDKGTAYPSRGALPFCIVHLTRHRFLQPLVKRHWFYNSDGICPHCGYWDFKPTPRGARCQRCGAHR